MKNTNPCRLAAKQGVGVKNMRHQKDSTLPMQSQPSPTQRARILARLRIGPATTQELRDELRIMHPAGRVLELRQRNEILTVRLKNRMARYILTKEAGHE